jgi:hypothetical protein
MFIFCKPASSKKRFIPFRQLNDDYSFTLFERASSIVREDWNSILKDKSLFLKSEYLELVEHGTYSKLISRYVIVYLRGKPCGIIYFQIVDFKAGIFGDLFSTQVEKSKSKRLNIFEKYIDINRDEVLMRLFTCGNNLVSGEHGFLFDETIKEKDAHELLLEIIEIVSKEEKLKAAISAVLIKDFYRSLKPAELFEDKKYSDFNVEPNMIVHLPAEIRSMQEYLDLFSKKYRNRAKSVFKALDGVEEKYLSAEEIAASESTMYQLYEKIFDKAKFKLIKLPGHYFTEVKELFPVQFTVKGYYKDGRMIAFASSFILPDNTLEAHYIGFDYALNAEYDLYQNILYSMINEAIICKCPRVNLGRTASEIKTTVGAKPEELICYIKPQNTISRLIQKPFINFLKPAPWTPRNPFKEVTEQTADRN